jgi:hypothetical protein
MYGRIFIAMKDDDRKATRRRILAGFAQPLLRSLAAHRRKRGRQIQSGPVRETRMYAHGCVNVRIRRPHDRSHRVASRKPGNVDASQVAAEFLCALARDAGDEGRLTAVSLLVLRLKPSSGLKHSRCWIAQDIRL